MYLRKAKLNNAHGCIFKTNELELLDIQLIEILSNFFNLFNQKCFSQSKINLKIFH